MTRLRGVASREVAPGAGVFSCVGEDDRGEPWAWLAEGGEPGREVEIEPARRLPCPPDLSRDALLRILGHWPAWRLARVAGVELGSAVAVLGSGWLAERVREMCRLRGARPSMDAVHGRPDLVILVDCGPEELGAATRACCDQGTIVAACRIGERFALNLYPDVHRRGLRLVALSPFDPPADAAEWSADARAIAGLLDRGLLPA